MGRMPAAVIVVLVALLLPATARGDWTLAGAHPVVDPGTDASQPVLADVGGVPHVAFNQAGIGIRVVRPDEDGVWRSVGGYLNTAIATGKPSVATLGGVLHVAWTQSEDDFASVRVARLVDDAWEPVGGALNVDSDADAEDPSLAVVGGVLHLAWSEGETWPGDIYAKRLVGGTWEAAGSVAVSASFAATGTEPEIADVGGVPHVAWQAASIMSDGPSTVDVARLDGSTWTLLGGAGESHRGTFVSIADVGGEPVIAFKAGPSDLPGELVVERHDGTAWVAVGGRVHPTVSGFNSTLAAVGGIPYVTSEDSAGDLRVFRFTGGAWEQAGSTIDAQGVLLHAFLTTVDGAPHVTSQGGGAGGSRTISVYRDGAPPTSTVAFDTATATAAEDAGSVTMTIERSATTGTSSVRVRSVPDTAAHGVDYGIVTQTVTFAEGDATKAVDIPITDDTLVEDAETFRVLLDQPAGTAVGTPGEAVVTITDDDLVDTEITSGPSGLVTTASQAWSFRGLPAEATLECALDDAAFAPCTSPLVRDVADGPHTFRVRATVDGTTDPTPAERAFTVDTVRPTAVPTLTGDRAPSGAFRGTVVAGAAARDPAPGSGIREVRCAVDPPQPPVSASDMTQRCPAIVSAPGRHTVYTAAVDHAGWAGLPAKADFVIAAVPDTVIHAGPDRETWITVGQFAFTATIPGSTFRCVLDGVDQPCTSPWTTPQLRSGDHVLEISAVSPEGVVDPTPARHAFKVRAASTLIRDCEVTKLPHSIPTFFGGEIGCEWYSNLTALAADKDLFDERCGKQNRCILLASGCPRGAECTLEATATFRDDDILPWLAVAEVAIEDEQPWLRIGWDRRHCRSDWAQSACSVTARTTAIGTGNPMLLSCRAGSGAVEQPPREYPKYGPADARRIGCRINVAIRPAPPLSTLGGDSGVSVSVPGAGTVTVGDAGSAGQRAVIAAAKRPTAFTAKPVTVKQAGAAAVRLKLSKASARTLKRKRRLVARLAVTFTPAGGGAPMRATRTVTLRAAPKVRRCERTKAGRRVCRTISGPTRAR